MSKKGSYRISCSKSSNSGVLKNSPKVISRPSQSFFTRLTETSRRLGSSILYTLDGVMPARLASSLGLMLRSLQISRKRFATASFTVIPITSRTAYRIVRKCVFAVAYFWKLFYNGGKIRGCVVKRRGSYGKRCLERAWLDCCSS